MLPRKTNGKLAVKRVSKFCYTGKLTVSWQFKEQVSLLLRRSSGKLKFKELSAKNK